MQTFLALVVAISCIFIAQKYFEVRRVLQRICHHPGERKLMGAVGIGSLLPRIPFVSSGRNALWRKYRDFEEYGSDILASISFLPTVSPHLYVADPVAVKEIIGSRVRFPKPIALYRALLLFGDNVVASDHDEWKRFRKICAPAFTEPNNKLVWEEAILVINDLFDNVWGGKKEVVVEHILDIFMPVALFIISAAAFGRRIAWKDEVIPPPGHKMSFKDALHTVTNDYLYKLMLPNWAMGLTKHLRHVHLGFTELEHYMVEMINDRKNQTLDAREEKYDLLSGLLSATQGEFDGESQLTDSEVLGNTFVFLLAGHETTAHTLCFAFGLLALYQEEQETLYQELKTVLADGRLPAYEDMNSLVFANAVLSESLRMFPPANVIPKYSAEDTVLTATNASGERVSVPVLKGMDVYIHTPGLHYNPKYWDEPNTFKPSRFLGDWPRDAYLPFSGGVRSCLGRRFAELESIVALTMFVSRYKIEIKEEPQFAGETFEQRKERILATVPRLTLTPVRIPLVFKRR